MPFALDGFEAHGLPMQGATVDVVRTGDAIAVTVNGRAAGRGAVGSPVRVAL
jgi:hypothetical protein